jgi:fatty acid kinase fatty acid binding subunit
MELDAVNTAVVLDSTADFTEQALRFTNWRVVPLYVSFGDESLRDYADLAPAEFYARLRTAGALPTTSQPSPADFAAVYHELRGYERIYSLHLSGSFSGTARSAAAAAEEEGGERIRVVDTGSISSAVALLGLALQERLERGTTDEEVEALIERFRAQHGILFTVETLEYLARGGRLGRAQAFAGQLLNVKPLLEIRGGEVLPLSRVRGARRALVGLADLFAERAGSGEDLRIAVAHADAPERASELGSLMLDRRPAAKLEVVTTLGAVVGTHAGPGAVGLFWF